MYYLFSIKILATICMKNLIGLSSRASKKTRTEELKKGKGKEKNLQ
jgi:hypothetical protein